MHSKCLKEPLSIKKYLNIPVVVKDVNLTDLQRHQYADLLHSLLAWPTKD
jgi:hypothetical protein